MTFQRRIRLACLFVCCLVLPATADELLLADLARRYPDTAFLREARALFTRAGDEGLSPARLARRARAGLLRHVTLDRMREALRAEVAVQVAARSLLGGRPAAPAEALGTLCDLLEVGVPRAALAALLAACPDDDLACASVQRPALFLVDMRSMGWAEEILRPLAVVAVRGRYDKDRLESVRHLLAFGRDLRLSDPQTVNIVRHGLAKGDSVRQIRFGLIARRTF